MTSNQARRWLKEQNIDMRPGKGGHLKLKNPANGRASILPVHGSRQEIGKGLWEKIKRDLGLD